MAKSKKQKRINADSLHRKKSSQNQVTKKINPFDIHQNKEKFKILGRTCKHDHGMPGISRSKALKKRQETLGQEFETYKKTNKFTDKRIGSNRSGVIDHSMNDDIANVRFTVDKMEQFKKNKKDLFNLNDDEILTHKGTTLEEIEQFHDSIASDDSEDDEALDSKFTESVHFGSGSNPIDRKEAIDDMIAEAKRKKAEITKDKEEIYNLTNQLDMNYKNLIPLLGKLSKTTDEPKTAPDDYDRALREMIFEPRGEVTDRLKSDEEIAKEEAERLERLENERLSRMKDAELGDGKPTHRSADDLDDGYFIGSDDEEEKATLAYDINGKTENNQSTEPENELEKENLSEDEESSIENENDGENDDTENLEETDSESDNFSDLKVSDSESEDDKPSDPKKKRTNNEQQFTKKLKKINKLENMNNQASSEMPKDYQELKHILFIENPENRNVIVERIIKCNHPKLDGKNREKIIDLFGYLIEFLCEIFNESNRTTTSTDENNVENSFKTLNFLMPHLYDLVQLNSEKITIKFIDIIKDKYLEYKKNSKIYPNIGTIVIFKIISNLYSTSDFRHPIVTPCFIFISHILSQARIKTRRDVAIGLFIVTITLEFTELSNRFLPAVFNFLQGIIYLSIPKRTIEVIKIMPPFQSSGQYNSILALTIENDVLFDDDISEQDEKLLANDLITILEIDRKFKIKTFNIVLKLIKNAIDISENNVGIGYYAEPILKLMEKLNLENYPNFVQTNWLVLEKVLINSTNKKLQKLVPPVRKPKALRLMEPRIVQIYDDKRRPKLSKDKEMRAIMLHKIKRETKGAVREIRRDTQFVQRIKIQKQIQSDIERNEKVRQIYAEASQQQGELNELSRQKKKGKF